MPHSPRASDPRRSRAPTGNATGTGSGSGGKKNKNAFLRQSSSLQDLSSYSKLDLEEGPAPDLLRPSRSPLLLSDAPSFSKDRSSSSSSIRRRCAAASSLSFALLSLFFLSYLFVLYLNEYRSRGGPTYYVVMDCGSTGTRIYVYESRVKDGAGVLPISLKPLSEDAGRMDSTAGPAYRRMETKPGLDKLVHNETGMRNAISPLVRWAEKQIPIAAHRRTYVYVYATAGVRQLPIPDSQWVLDKALEVLKSKTRFVCRRSWVKTISGMEEAYFGWIALNYQMGLLGSTNETSGALDLGGSSLQVTFGNDEPNPDDHSLSLHIGSVYHNLIAYSLSGYGLNDAFDKSVAHLLKQQNVVDFGKVEVKHPCLNDGYREMYACSNCARQRGDSAEAANPAKEGRGGRASVQVRLVGAPDWKDCSALAKSTVNLSEWSALGKTLDCDIRPCALADNLPRPRGHFYAMSGFFVVFKFFNLNSDATIDKMLQKGQEFCGKTWKLARKSVIPQPFVEQYCFRAPYVASLLRDGLHIRDSEVEISSSDVTWTLGVALVEAGQAFSKSIPFANYTILPGSISPTVLVFMLVFSLMFLCAISFASKHLRTAFRKAHLPLLWRSTGAGSFQYFNSGDSRSKPPLSPTVAKTESTRFIIVNAKGSEINSTQTEEPIIHSTSGVLHSYSYNNLTQVHDGIRSSWAPPHRNKARLWSRKSQSREDLSSLTEIHMVKS